MKRRRSSVGANPIRQLSLQPVATGAAVEAMKRLKPLVDEVTLGDPASRQAVT
ncbi:MAG: hypothetical protein LAO31_22075 [Acidobacteriia bacterium]|nr:hypothetical protein [Terriglobia bacterium]